MFFLQDDIVDSEELADDAQFHSADYNSVPNAEELVCGVSSVTKGQLFTLVYAFVLRHCCTETALADLIILFNTVISGCLPFNIYFFKKLLNPSVTSKIEKHVYCNCGAYLAKCDDVSLNVVCDECQQENKCAELLRKGSYFQVYPLEQQIKSLLETRGIYEHLVNCNESGCDIGTGSEYRKRSFS